MVIITNEQFVTNRARIARFASILGFAALAGGFVFSWMMTGEQLVDTWRVAAAYGSLIIGLLAVNIGRYNNVRWGRRPREEEILSNSLKGLDYKYRLYNYQKHLPVDHLLLSPFGLFVLEARPFYGQIANQGDRWRRKGGVWAILQMFAEGGLGNPTREAHRAAGAVERMLRNVLPSEEAARVAVEPVIVLTSPLAKPEIVEPAVPVVIPKELRAHLRATAGRTKISNEMHRSLTKILDATEGA